MLALLRTALEEGVGTLVEAVVSAGPAIWASLWTSVAATLLAVVIGATLAVLTERTDVPGRRGLRLAMLLALIVPGYVAAMGWLEHVWTGRHVRRPLRGVPAGAGGSAWASSP